MLNEREVRYRMKCAVDQDVPITNYGLAIAYMQGILKRSVSMFPYLAEELRIKICRWCIFSIFQSYI